ncbi:MAG TPA: hypothetical protein P5270_01950 [Victivallales bacterium]|nr:hypothetical protein [Victivallales bacterium]
MDLVGFAPGSRFDNVHYRMHPKAHLEDAKTVICIAIRYPIAMYENAGRTKAESYMSLDSYEGNAMISAIQGAAMNITRIIEDFGFKAVPISLGKYRVQPYKDISEPWSQDFRNDVAAVAAGLGEIGLNGVVITPEFGTRQMITSVVTNAELQASPLYSGPALCDKCGKCVKACKMRAFNTEKTIKIKIAEKSFEVFEKDQWRCMWSKKFMLNAEMGPKLHGLNVTIEPPERQINEEDVRKALSEKGAKGGLQTWYTYSMRECERECVPPHLRGKDLVKVHSERVQSQKRREVQI